MMMMMIIIIIMLAGVAVGPRIKKRVPEIHNRVLFAMKNKMPIHKNVY